MASRVDGGKHAVAANTIAPVIVAQDRSASCGSVSFIQLQASLHLFTYKIASSKRANVQNITGSMSSRSIDVALKAWLPEIV